MNRLILAIILILMPVSASAMIINDTDGDKATITVENNHTSLDVHVANDPQLDLSAGDHGSATVVIHKFGEAGDCDNSEGYLDVWDGVAESREINTYTFSTSANIMYISSSDNGDTQDMEVQGLDSSWEPSVQTVTLTGQTVATFSTMIRVFRVKNLGTTDNAGNVYVGTTSSVTAGVPDDPATVRAIMGIGNNQTLMAIWTCRSGATCYMYNFYTGLSRRTTVSAIIELRIRPVGGVFQLKHRDSISSVGTSHFQHMYTVPQKISAKSDVKMRVECNANDTGVSAGFEIIVVPN